MTQDDLWILLSDPHERGDIDGLWGLGVHALRSARGAPWVLTEDRLVRCTQAAVPAARVILTPRDGPFRKLEGFDPTAGAIHLLFLRECVPDPAQWSAIRSFGTRASLLGAVASTTLRRPLHACIADPVDDPNHVRVAAARVQQAWIIKTAQVVEAPDAESRARLEELHLPPVGKVRIADAAVGTPQTNVVPPAGPGSILPEPEQAAGAREGPPERPGKKPIAIAVLGSRRSPKANRTVLRALRRVSLRIHSNGGVPSEQVRVDWLARFEGYTAARCLQDVRRFGLAEIFYREEEPWANPPRRGMPRWNILLDPDPSTGPRPLLTVGRAAGCEVLAPGPNADWNAAALAARILEGWPVAAGQAGGDRSPEGRSSRSSLESQWEAIRR